MKLDELKERKKLLESMVFTSNFNSLNEIMCDWIKDELTEVKSNIDIIERNIIYNNEMKIKMNSVLSNILSIYVKRIIWSYPIKNHEEKLILIKKRIKKLIFSDININDFLNEYVDILNDFIRLTEDIKIKVDVIFDESNKENIFESNINEDYIIYSIKLYLKNDDKETSLIRILYHDNMFSLLSLEDVCLKNKCNDVVVPVKEEKKLKKLDNTARAIILAIISTITVALFVVFKTTFIMPYISGLILGILWLYIYLK